MVEIVSSTFFQDNELLSLCIKLFLRPQYFTFQLPSDEATICLELADRGILIASWLAAVCRTELSRFREFISWLRFGKVSLFALKSLLTKFV
jgi:hypothetical protein